MGPNIPSVQGPGLPVIIAYYLHRKWKWKSLSHVWHFATPWTRPEYGVDSFSLLQGIFPTQGSNPGLPHCRRILYQLSHKGRPFTRSREFITFISVYWRLAVDKNNRRGTLLDWIPKCESNGFSSLLDLPDPLLLLPLTAPPTLPPAADSLRLTRCSVHLVFLEAHVPEPSYQLQTEWLSSAPRAPMSSLSLSDPLFLGTHVALWFGSSLGPPVLSQ